MRWRQKKMDGEHEQPSSSIRTFLVPVAPCDDRDARDEGLVLSRSSADRGAHQTSQHSASATTTNHPPPAPRRFVGHIELNRPRALNALDVHMVETILKTLHDWRIRADVTGVVVRASAESTTTARPVFCSGGDVKQVVTRGLRGDVEWGLRYFTSEYHMNMTMARLASKTDGSGGLDVVSVNDGITFGGGVGISIHNRYQVCTENTVFAMPECPIGLFPDVGGSYFLSRRGALGLYLALTGARLHGRDVQRAGLATHFIRSSRLPGLMAAMARHGSVELALREASAGTAEGANDDKDDTKDDKEEGNAAGGFPFDIDLGEVFRYDVGVEEIVEGCRRNARGSTAAAFWKEADELLGRSSPTSLRITLELMKRGRAMPLEECLRNENRVIQRLVRDRSSDFYVGVTARLIDRTGSPRWGPVQNTGRFLEPLEPNLELQLGCTYSGRF